MKVGEREPTLVKDIIKITRKSVENDSHSKHEDWCQDCGRDLTGPSSSLPGHVQRPPAQETRG